MTPEDSASPTSVESTLRFALQYRPWTVVFYSYRGGVGRTTALLSTAVFLADSIGKKKRIAIIDFDLEAPGIDAFPSLAPDDPQQPGLLEYLDACTADADTTSDIRQFVYERKIRNSTVLIMRTGRQDANYRRLIGRLDLDHLYRFENGELIFENLRAALKQELGVEILLIDSRTGITEIGGVCLGHLADACVLVFQPTIAHGKGLPDVVDRLLKRVSSAKCAVPFVFLVSKTPLSSKNKFQSQSIDQAKSIVLTCCPAKQVNVHEELNVEESGLPQAGEFDFVNETHVVFLPIRDSSNTVGLLTAPESYLLDIDDQNAMSANYAIEFLLLFCKDSRDQVLQIESDREAVPRFASLFLEYRSQPDEGKLNSLLEHKFGRFLLKTMALSEVDSLPIEQQVVVLKLKQTEE